VAGYSYRWRDDESDADLVGVDSETTLVANDSQRGRFRAAHSAINCTPTVAGSTLGPSSHNSTTRSNIQSPAAREPTRDAVGDRMLDIPAARPREHVCRTLATINDATRTSRTARETTST